MTLNCWAIGYVPVLKSPDRGIRIEAIGLHLETCGSRYDVVCLQELWLQSDRTKIVERSKETLPYSMEFHDGTIGTGLLVLSKFPLRNPSYKLFSLNGYPHQIWYGDSLCGSGIGTATMELPNDFTVLICTSHFHAEYKRDNDQFLPDRICQALEAIEEIDSKRDLADAVIYAGDFNTEQGDLPHQILTKMGGLQDARGDVSPDPSFNAHWNTYFNPKERTATIDYVLIGTNLGTKVAKTHCQNPLPSQIPRKNVSYSDHEGVWAQIEFITKNVRDTDEKKDSDMNGLINLNIDIQDILSLERERMQCSIWILLLIWAAMAWLLDWLDYWLILILIFTCLCYIAVQNYHRIVVTSTQIKAMTEMFQVHNNQSQNK